MGVNILKISEQGVEAQAPAAGNETFPVSPATSGKVIMEPVEVQSLDAQGAINDTALSYDVPLTIDQSAADTVRFVNIAEGAHYVLNFPGDVVESAYREGDKITLTFTDGGVLVLQKIRGADGQYDLSAFEGEAARFVTALELEALQEQINQIAAKEAVQAELRKLNLEEIFAQTAANENDTNVIKLAAIQPAAGELTASDVAAIEPAAGGDAPLSSGAGIQSSFIATQFNTIPDVGPINPTSLQYGVPVVGGEIFVLAAAAGPQFPQVSGSGQNIDEGGLAPTLVTTGQVPFNIGPNTPGTLTLGEASTFRATGSVDNGVLSSGGDPITVVVNGNTATGTAAGRQIFTITLQNDGTYTFTLFDTLDHADGADPNDVIDLFFGVTATDSTGAVSTNEITINVADDAPVATNDFDNAPNNTTVNGNVLTNDDIGQDTPGALTSVSINGTTVVVPAVGNATIAGAFGTLTIAADGSYSYTANALGNGADVFSYTITDFDDDTATATLAIAAGTDVAPIVTNPAVVTVDETDLNGGANSPQSVTGTVNVNYGVNAPGAVTPAGANTVAFSGALNNQLTSNGNPVTITVNGDTYIGSANGQTIFTLQVEADGDFTFNLLGSLDHADANDPNDTIQITFGVNATDIDNDTTAGTITVNVLDDGPVAVDDSATVNSGSTITGNVLTNDDAGEDGLGAVTIVTLNGVDTAVPNGGSVTVNGQFGVLTMNSDGSYSYAANAGANGSDAFGYTMRDFDGDSDAVLSSAGLNLNVTTPAGDLLVGTNVDDNPGSNVPHEVGGGSGTITGTVDSDILIGDVGGATQQNQGPNYNFVLILDVSGSMGDINDPNSRIQLLKGAVNNLMGDLNAYNGGQVNVHIVPFSNSPVRPTATFTVTDAQGFGDAQDFVNALVPGGLTNYEQPLQSAISYYQSPAAIAGATNVTYFISDDEPNRYVDANGDNESADDAFIMGEVTGTDGTDEVGTLQALGEVIAVGIDLGADIDNLHIIDSSGQAIDVQNPADLSAVLQGANPIIQLGSVGDDTLNGGGGGDIIFGDAVNTDALATAEGLNTDPGDSWSVFTALEAGQGNTTPGWTRTDTENYIRNNSSTLAQESQNNFNVGRSGGDDIINGGDGNDLIYGQEGRDFITGGAGVDRLSGGSGNDVFIYESNTGDVDTIIDFSTAEGDRIDISDLLVGYDPLQDSINDFVFGVEANGNTTIMVDANGTGNIANAFGIAVLENVTGLNLQTITNNGEAVA